MPIIITYLCFPNHKANDELGSSDVHWAPKKKVDSQQLLSAAGEDFTVMS